MAKKKKIMIAIIPAVFLILCLCVFLIYQFQKGGLIAELFKEALIN